MEKIKTFKSFFDFGLDFLFPADEMVENIRDLPADELASRLPASEDNLSGTNSLFAYSDESVKHLVWEIKYHKNEMLAETVGAILARSISAQFAGQEDTFLVVPIPQTKQRLRERGFHHTKLIAESIVEHLPANFVLADDILKKVRSTPKQSSIENRQERFENIIGAFAVNESPGTVTCLTGKNIILVDDVITTGATVSEARRVLELAGIRSIFAWAIAH
jgi:ComF family protein